MNTFLVSIPCTDENAAQLFHAWLLSEGVDVQGVDGRNVLVPTDFPPFVFDLSQAAVLHGFAHDTEAARAANAFLKGLSL